MSYENIINKLKAKGIESEITTVQKNNDSKKTGIKVNQAIFYVSGLDENEDKEVEYILSNLDFKLDTTDLYKTEKLYVKLISREMNEEKLKDLIYRPFLDLAIVPCCAVGDNASFEVKKSLLPSFTDFTTEDELIDEAIKNTTNVNGNFHLNNMFGMNYLTTEKFIWGATAMLFAKDLITEEVYIIPSSVHEIILMNVDNISPSELKDMVKEVNCQNVAPEEVLSYSIYKYNPKLDKIEVVA